MYPHSADPSAGIFIEEAITHLKDDVHVKVLSPTPWFPPIRYFTRWYKYRLRPKYEIRKGIEIYRPKTLFLFKDSLSLQGVGYFLSTLVLIFNLKRKFNFDIIHAHRIYPSGFAAVLLGKVFNKKVIITAHAGNFRSLYSATRKLLAKYALRMCSLCIFVSNSQKKQIISQVDFKIQSEVIPNGVSKQFFSLKEPSKSKKISNKKEINKVILFVGHLIEAKGLRYLLESIHYLVNDGLTNVKCILIGEGVLKNELVETAERLKLSSRVDFIGLLSHDKVLDKMKTCDLLVLPSLHESFGVVLIEAMACGKPVVATRCGGPEEIITKETGVLVPPKNSAALAKGIKFAFQNLDKYDNNNISKLALKYNFESINKTLLNTYNRVLSN
jgi:glycosyltransferase involved in cell wall biosynthesis